MNKLAVFSTLFFLVAATASAQIYKWVDADGRVHFSDRPLESTAEKVSVFDSDGGKVEPASKTTTETRQASPQRKPTEKRTSSITADDYKITTNLSQRGSVLVFSGRVENGPPCPRLTLKMYARTSNGGIENASTVVENAGGFGSKVFEARITPWPETNDKWSLSSVFAACN
jgi:hypothetical protein